MTNFVFSFLVLLIFPSLAFAYLDPGTGSYIFQLAIAGLVGAAYFIKLYWFKVKAIFAKKKLTTEKKPAEQSQQPEENFESKHSK